MGNVFSNYFYDFIIFFKILKKENKNRADIFFLVDSFYIKVWTSSHLGPIFNNAIDDLHDYLERLTDFWESILFFKNEFKGDFIKVDQKVNAKTRDLLKLDILEFDWIYGMKLWIPIAKGI